MSLKENGYIYWYDKWGNVIKGNPLKTTPVKTEVDHLITYGIVFNNGTTEKINVEEKE